MKISKSTSFISVIKNKYFLTILVFGIWLLVFDQHNLIDRWKSRIHLNKLEEDTTYYFNKIAEDRELIRELLSGPEQLEKFAREQYLMKKPDEDVFIILKKDHINK